MLLLIITMYASDNNAADYDAAADKDAAVSDSTKDNGVLLITKHLLIHDADGVSDAADADYYGAYAADAVDNYSVVAGGGKDSAIQRLMTVLVRTAWSHCFEECLPRVCSAESLFLCPLLTKTLLHVLLLHLLLFILIYLYITVVSIPPDAFYLLRHTPRLSFISPRGVQYV